MESLTFNKYPLSRILNIRNLSTAHYLPMIQNYSTPPHQHTAWEFVFCDHGHATVFQGNEHWELTANHLILHPPKRDHHLLVEDDPTTLIILSFVCNSGSLKLLQNKVIPVNPEQRKLLPLIVQEFYNAFELEDGRLLLGDFHPSSSAPLGSEQMITGYIEGFLIGLLRSVTNQIGQPWNPAALEYALGNRLAYEIKKYVSENLSKQITIEMLSDYLHYSRSYITSQFRHTTGESISKYIARARIDRAKQLIVSGKWTLSQVAEMTGFSSLPYFSKCFKAAAGLSPSRYLPK